MSEFSVSYTEKALSDLDDIYNYIANNLKEPQIASKLVSRLTKAIDDLSFMAESYHFYTEEPFYSQGMRYFTEGNYCIFYKVQDKTAFVVRILYGARNFIDLL